MFRIIFCLLLAMRLVAGTGPDWDHFDDNVFRKAQAAKKPVLLHLRANWCHWCHVMEEKTYADPAVVAYLDTHFIACSEDHDERADLTSRYSDYGWPATIIFDAEGHELFKQAGYIPADEFMEVLKSIAAGKTKLKNAPKNTAAKTADKGGQEASLKTLQQLFTSSLDTNSGGFGFGQKYIDFETYEYALNHYRERPELRSWLKKTTDNSTGINDTVWGGIYQYSTNNDWEHVHYEKLLAAQARYMKAYCWYYNTFKDPKALDKALHIAQYVNRFLKSPNGGFYNAQDADLIKGEKASGYFALDNEGRMAKGIPAIDTNRYTNENALLMESFVILWSATGTEAYLQEAKNIASFLMSQRATSDGGFMHAGKPNGIVFLNDNLYASKALLMLYRACGDYAYVNALKQNIAYIHKTFYAGNCYNSYAGKSALPATYNISENIELTRDLNLLSYVLEDSSLRINARKTLSFLLSAPVVKKMYTEPGLLSAYEESKTEPLSGSCFQKSPGSPDTTILRALTAVPVFYIQSGLYTARTVPAGKKELFETVDINTVFFCTSAFCSPPMYTANEINAFIRKSILKVP